MHPLIYGVRVRLSAARGAAQLAPPSWVGSMDLHGLKISRVCLSAPISRVCPPNPNISRNCSTHGTRHSHAGTHFTQSSHPPFVTTRVRRDHEKRPTAHKKMVGRTSLARVTPRKRWTRGRHPPPILASLSTMAAVRTLASRTVFRRLVLREWRIPSICT